MRRIKDFTARALAFTAALALCAGTVSAQKLRSTDQGRINIDSSWFFHQGDVQGAQEQGFDESAWRVLDVPHDWSIEGYAEEKNTTGRGGGYMPSGIGWYRKHITVPKLFQSQNKSVLIDLKGVMENGEVWINGQYLGMHPYGYTGIIYDLTPYIIWGEDNVIAVKTDTTPQPASRWYSGAGIFRHVDLIVKNPVSFDNFGVHVTTTSITKEKAVINIESAITNNSEHRSTVSVQISIAGPDGSVYNSSQEIRMDPSSSEKSSQYIEIPSPILWDINDPELYKVDVTLRQGPRTSDQYSCNLGIRTTEWKAESGFWLNGRNIDISGVCMHHEAGLFGAAVPASVWERRIKAIKDLGCVAIRTAHNPMDDEFLDMCDKLGMLVMSEAFDVWEVRKNPHDYSRAFTEWCERDITDMVLRARNHPSVFIYSIGNEMHEDYSKPRSFEIFETLRDICHKLDSDVPVIMAAVNPNHWGSYENGFADLGDIVAHNYRDMELINAHEQKPSRIILGSESHQSPDAWEYVKKYPFMSGVFLWTGWDYLGEAVWPNISSRSGLLTRSGQMKPLGWQHKTWWVEDEPIVRISRSKALDERTTLQREDWAFTKDELGKDGTVSIYTNCEEVDLYINGKKVLTEKAHADFTPITFTTQYKEGDIKAVGRNNGKEVAEHRMVTPGKPSAIELRLDREVISNTWDDVVYCYATVVDQDGNICPNEDIAISFSVKGKGTVIGVDNDDNASHESYRGGSRKAYLGSAHAALRGTGKGKITVTASAKGLKKQSGSVIVK